MLPWSRHSTCKITIHPISGFSRRRVIWDVVKTRPGRTLTRSIAGEEMRRVLAGSGRAMKGRVRRTDRRKKKWYQLEL